MKRILVLVMVLAAMAVYMNGCGYPYYDSDSGKLDTNALAIDALDDAFPEIVENISEEQLMELLDDERCSQILTDRIIELMSDQDAAMTEYCTIEDATELMVYAFGEEGDAWSSELTGIYGSEIIENCR